MSLIKSGNTRNRTRPKIRDGINITGLNNDDMRLLYHAYRLETLPWKLPFGLSPKEVLFQVQNILEENYPLAWSVRDREKPLFVIFANMAWGGIFLDAPIFSAKASERQILEGSITLLEKLKLEAPVLVGTDTNKKKFFERLQDYKILRRVGTLHDMNHRYLFQVR